MKTYLHFSRVIFLILAIVLTPKISLPQDDHGDIIKVESSSNTTVGISELSDSEDIIYRSSIRAAGHCESCDEIGCADGLTCVCGNWFQCRCCYGLDDGDCPNDCDGDSGCFIQTGVR